MTIKTVYLAIVMTFSSCYVFLGIVPIVYGAWYGLWVVFCLGSIAWLLNGVLLGYVNKILDSWA